MKDMKDRKCEACRVGAPGVTPDEIEHYLPMIPDWRIIEEAGEKTLMRAFDTGNFTRTMRFVNAVAEIADEEDHHPVMKVEYGAVTVWWWTHKIGGLHMNDFIMAAKTDYIFKTIPTEAK